MHSVKSSDGSCVSPSHSTGFIFCMWDKIDQLALMFSCIVDEETHCINTKVGQVVAGAGDSPLTSASE